MAPATTQHRAMRCRGRNHAESLAGQRLVWLASGFFDVGWRRASGFFGLGSGDVGQSDAGAVVVFEYVCGSNLQGYLYTKAGRGVSGDI